MYKIGSNLMRVGGSMGRAPVGTFPLSVNGRYLQTADSSPHFLQIDTCWSLAVQASDAQIITYLDDRQARGFNCIIFNAIEHHFSDNSPAYENVDGFAPFTSMTDFASTLVESYWTRVDYIVDQAKARGMAVIMFPAYLGYLGGTEGWMSEVTAESAGDLQTYGATLATRYAQGNVIWGLGGDFAGDTTQRNKQWNIVTGIRTVRTTDIILGHPGPDTTGYTYWNGYTGWNLNLLYCYEDAGTYPYAQAATEYGRAGPIPFIFFEGRYENYTGWSAGEIRRQAWESVCSGACGQGYGNAPVWDLGSAASSGGGVTAALTHLDDTGAVEMSYVKALVDAYNWHLLVPKTDTSLVTTSLGTGTSRICPSLASDGSFAFIWKPASGASTVNFAGMTPSSVRARFYDPTAGTFSTVSGSPFANSGTQSITWPGERVLVMDAA